MAITFFGNTGNPTDGGSSSATVLTAVPPSSMVTGDLVTVYAYQRGTATVSVTETGGQNWTSQMTIPGSPGPILAGTMFWCRYDGTWSANPTFTFTSGTNTSLVLIVFRPTVSTNLWATDPTGPGASGAGTFTGGGAPSSPFTVTASPFGTPTNASTVAIACWMTDDDNTWGSLSGSGWNDITPAQYRNTAGQDTSSSYAYNIKTSATAIADVSKNQATLGGDPFVTGKIVFYEYAPTPTRTPRPTSVGHPFIF